MRETIVTAIDIGSYYVTTIISTFNNETTSPQIIGIGRVRSVGIRKGRIIDIDDAISVIGESIKEAEKSASVSISRALVSVGGSHITAIPSRGVIAVSRADGEISQDDVSRVQDAASTIVLPKNREILHNFSHNYIVDGEEDLRDVIGMVGTRLETNSLIITGSSAHIKDLTRCINDNDIDPQYFVLSPIAAAKAVLSRHQKELGVLCLDIGGGNTSLAVYEDGNLIHANVLPIGGDNLTNDLAIGLRINVDTAERIKREYGMAIQSEVPRRDTVDLSQFDPSEKDIISRKNLVEIMEARLNEIFELVNADLRLIGKEAFLPGGVVIVGGTAKVPHIVDLCRQKLRLPVQIGFPRDVEGIASSVDDPSYATSMGLIFWGLEQKEYGFGSLSLPDFAFMNKAGNYVRKWIKALLP